MKKIVVTLLLAAILLAMTPMSATLAEASYATVQSGNQYGVRLRLGPSTSYASQTTLPSGTVVTVLEKGTVWTRIQAGTLSGYMMSKFLVSSSGSSTSSTPSLGTATVYAGNGLRTWLRTAPNGRRLGLYSDGTPLTILGYKGQWTRVMIGSSVGYMMTKYIALPAPTPEPTPIPYSALTKVELNYEYPLVGDTLLATITPSQATVTYQWYRDKVGGTKLSTAAAYTATTADVGHKICVEVTGTGQWAGQKVSVLSQPVTKERKVAGVMIVNTIADHSAPLAGDILKAVVAPSSATVTYSWRVAGVEKGKEATYVVQASDSGKQIQVYATGTGDFSGQAASDMTSKVADALELKEVKLSTSFPVVGQAITATVTPGSATASYVWYVDGIKMGSGASYTPTAFDMGKVITVKATGTDKCAGTVESAASQPVKMVNLTKVSLDSNAPVVGMTLTATAEPAEARTANSVLYYWYVSGEDKPVQSGWSNTYQVNATYKDEKGNDQPMAGKAIYVRAYGQGIYGGVVASAISSPVNSKYTLNAVTLSVTEPVVGDVITAVSDPQNLSKADCLYLWQIGTVTKSSTDNTYTVTSDDVGKQIRVTLKYNGATATSAATNKVLDSKNITGAYLYNESTKQNIGSQPHVGQTISVKVNPSEAAASGCVKYTWTRTEADNKTTTNVGSGASYVVTAADAGRPLTVKVEAQGNYAINNKDKFFTASTTVAGGQPINVTLPAAITPKVGQSPVLKLNNNTLKDASGKDVVYSATITWSPSLSDNGTFRTGESYKAVVNFTSLTGGYRLGSVSATDVDGKTSVSGSLVGNTVTINFGKLTATQEVDNFCIYGVTAPEKGKTPVTAIRDCAQYKGTVAWQDEKGNAVTIFEANKVYKAVISLTSAAEYTFPNSGKSLFTVPGAVSAEYNKTGDHTATVTATFNPITTATKAEVYADRDSVTVGTSKKYVVCTALLSGFTGDQDSLTWSWTLANGTADETKIDQNGIVTIDADEKAGLELLVTASTTVEGKAYYSASTTIKTATDDSTGDLAPVVTIVKSVSELQAGKETTFIATVQNSNNETVRWSVEGVDGDKSSGTTIGSSTGVLKISRFETVKQLKVTATAVPTGETAVCYVTVVYAEAPISITFVEGQKSVSIGQKAAFKVAISAAEANPKAQFAVAASNGATDVTIASTTNDTCTVNVPDDPALVGKEIFLTARYACKDDDGKEHEVSAKWSFIITETAPEAKAAIMTLEGAALLPDDDFAVADDEPAAQPEEAATAPAKGIDTKSDSISLVISGGEEEPAAKDEESKEAPETEEKPAEEPKAEEKPAEPAVRKTEINTKNENIKLVISGGDEEPVQTEKTKDEAPAEAETEKETVVVNEKEKKDAKEQKPVKKEEAPAEIGVTVYGPDVAKVVPGKVYTFSAEVSCAVEGYDIVWSVYCSDETVKASIVDGELYVTENPTGEDQVLRIRARYKDADGNLYSEGSYASFHVTVAPGIAKPRVIKESKPAEKESENGKAAEAEGNKEPAKVEESKETVKPETTEPKKIYEDDRDDPDYVPFD